MRDILFFSILSLLFYQLNAQNAPYAVEVAAFAEPVPDGHFGSISKVYETLDANYIYRYYIDASSKEEAETTKSSVQKAGFSNARIVDFKYLAENCNATCEYIPPKKTGKTVAPFEAIVSEYSAIQNVHCIFFDFDKSNIRKDAKLELDILTKVLQQNKDYKLAILAHTDARGSIEYNRALSNRRALATQNYLISQGIAKSRMSRKTFGESTPIALNELSNGEDTELGRQFNRRVEFKILDKNGKVLNMVDEINVPTEVKN